MLAKVEVLSRPEPQLVANTEDPKGLDGPSMLGLCGMEPARRRDNIAALLELIADSFACCSTAGGGLKGLVEGVGREVLESKVC